MMADPTVFIVDDDEAMRDSLSILLRAHGFRPETYSSGPAFLESFDRDRPGCLLIDIRMPEVDGLTVQETLAGMGAHLPVIIMTAHGDVATAVRAMKAGATDFLEKPFAEDALLEAVNRSLERDREGRATAERIDDVLSRVKTLTARELEVFDLLVKGKSNKVIARDLGISPRTAELHRARVLYKMNANNLSHLVRIAMTAGIARSSD